MSKKNILIDDTQSFVSAQTAFGSDLKTFDDGYGPLWIARNSSGVVGIVRAKSFEDAYGICEDEFFPEADETIEEIAKEYGFRRDHKKVIRDATAPASKHCEAGTRFCTDADYIDGKLPPDKFVRWHTIETPDSEAWSENELFQEAYGFRPNGANVNDKHKHGIYSKDLNGEHLDLLTPELVRDIGLHLVIETTSTDKEELEPADALIETLERSKSHLGSAALAIGKADAFKPREIERFRYLLNEIERQLNDARAQLRYARVINE